MHTITVEVPPRIAPNFFGESLKPKYGSSSFVKATEQQVSEREIQTFPPEKVGSRPESSLQRQQLCARAYLVQIRGKSCSQTD